MSLIVLFVLACGDDSGDGGPVIPVEGHWTVTSNAVLIDSCGLIQTDPPNGIPQGYTISDVDGDALSFVLQGDLENDLQDCTVDGAAWACADLVETESGSQEGTSYTMTYTWSYSGRMESETTIDLGILMALSCMGDVELCRGIEDAYDIEFPCALSVEQAVAAD